MGRSGQATEYTSQQILDKVNEEVTTEYTELVLAIYEVVAELKTINIQLAEITGDEL